MKAKAKAVLENLVPDEGQSFRCFNRAKLTSPVKWHRHPEIELTFIRKGSGSRVVGDNISNYTDHDLVLLGSNLPHTWASDEFLDQKHDRHPAIVVQFHPDFLGPEVLLAPEFTAILATIEAAERGIWFPPDVARSVGLRMEHMTQVRGMRRLVGLFDCLDELTRVDTFEFLASEEYSGPTNVEAASRIRTVCDHIQHNFTDPDLSACVLGDLIGMNASAFSRFFKQRTGHTPSRYICELRIGYACRQLIETDKSIAEISFDAGYASPSYFNRSFRSLRGISPSKYRQQHVQVRDEAAI